MNMKPLLRLLILVQTFLLFAFISLPLLVHALQDTAGKAAYGLLSAICILIALKLRRELANLE